MGRTRKRRNEAGIALLIAIFILLLIGVVAIALVVSSGTESALAGNYRSSTSVYYAALAGLEEVRGRLRGNNPNSFKNTDPGFLPAGALAACSPVYVLNPAPGEVIAPWDPGSAYPDNQFGQEYAGICPPIPSPSPSTPSIWNNGPLAGLPFPAPFYKWVRINSVTEKSLNLDTSPYDAKLDATLVYYGSVPPSPPALNDAGIGGQVFELTALAVLPNGSRKLLQYLVASNAINLAFPATLTLNGNNVQFSVPTSTSFWVNGADQGSVGTCNPGASVVAAVGYTNGGDSSQTNILSAIPSGPPASQDRRDHYTNGVAPTPNVSLVTASPDLSTVAGLNALVQAITQDADVVINGNATESDMPNAMSASNPMTIVVNGNLTFNGWPATGYGLLLVTGEFTYDPDASWDGIVLVIGTGKLYSYQNGTGSFQGAVFLARTLDAAGNPLPSGSPLGQPFFDSTSVSGGNGIYYSSCWIQAAQPPAGYKILSFHEISQ